MLRLTIAILAALLIAGCGLNPKEKELKTFIENHEKVIKPLNKEAALAYWEAANKGDAALYDKFSALELQRRQIYSNREEFAMLKKLKNSNEIKDPILARELDVLYRKYLENQIPAELLKKTVELSSEIEKKFSNFRASIDGKVITNNEIDAILKQETDSRKRKKIWEASKQVGEEVADDIIKLVKLRNKAAVELGYDNYHSMALDISEQNSEEITAIFNELYELTNEPFRNLKHELDSILAEMYGIGTGGLMPWHYHDPFFQETPLVYTLDLDSYYRGRDIKKLAADFYDGIGMSVEAILQNSDLYEREGKNPHAFCTDIDREGDVRVLCNLKDTERWMETMLHELGHAVYDKYHDPDVPYLLREPAHIFTTEAVAMFFGRLSRNPDWMQKMLGLSDEQRAKIAEVSGKYARLKQLIFARWAMVMFFFEKELYTNPDRDLNGLWWELVEKYQFVKRPPRRNAPDWAAKIHFTIAPCYYHNYLLGELFASQMHHHLVYNVLHLSGDDHCSYVGRPEVGKYFKKYVFAPGATMHWNDMIKNATGEPLTAKYFVQQFVQK